MISKAGSAIFAGLVFFCGYPCDRIEQAVTVLGWNGALRRFFDVIHEIFYKTQGKPVMTYHTRKNVYYVLHQISIQQDASEVTIDLNIRATNLLISIQRIQQRITYPFDTMTGNMKIAA
ncbi:hypothetical protein D3C74_388420 [compost metagenome]